MKRTDDIANLFHSFGASSDSYLEMDSNFEYVEKPSSLRAVERHVLPVQVQSGSQPDALPAALNPLHKLLHEVAAARQAEAQARNDQALMQVLDKTRPPVCKAKVVAVVSGKGGVGKSTLSAGLATLLRLSGGQTLAIDLDPQSALQHHLSISPDVAGMGNASLTGENWRSLLLPGSAGTQLLPYGTLNEEERRALEHALAVDPHWLARHLSTMDLGASDVVVIDTPPGRTAYLEQVLAVADQVLVVIAADAACYQTLDQMERLLQPSDSRPLPAPFSYVVNQFDASRTFSRDMLEVLRRRLGERLIGVVHADHVINEALAYGRNPVEGVCATQGCRDILSLGLAMTARLIAQSANEPDPS